MQNPHASLGTATRLFLALTLLVTVPLGVTGCAKEPALRSYGEPTGLFHIKVREDWQVNVQPGFMSVYAGSEFPAEDVFDALSVLIFVVVPTEGEPADALTTLISNRAKEREWQEYETGDMQDTRLGNRIAHKRHVTGIDARGNHFAADYVIARTNDREVLVVAVAPAETWESDRVAAATLLEEEWYWHIPDPAVTIDASAEETTTLPSDTSGEPEGGSGGSGDSGG